MSKSETLTDSPTVDLATSIVDVLRQELAEGIYDHNTLFTEVALSKRFSVSRTPVREALLLLERDGLLVQRERSFGLPQYSRQQMADLFAVRLQLEPYAIRRIVELRSKSDIDNYVQWARKQLPAPGAPVPTADEYISINQKVQWGLIKLSHNPFIRDAIQIFDYQTAFIRQKTLRVATNRELSIALAHELLDTLSKHNPEAAEQAVTRSLIAANAAIDQVLPE